MVNYGYIEIDDSYRSGTSALPFILSSPVTISGARQRVTEEKIPGKNGTVLLWDGSYEQRTAEVKGAIFGNSLSVDNDETIFDKLERINRRLRTNTATRVKFATQAMKEAVSPTFFLARCENGIAVKSVNNELAQVEFKLDLNPQRFFQSGDTAEEFTLQGTLGTSAQPLEFFNESNQSSSPHVAINVNWSESARASFDLYINGKRCVKFARSNTSGTISGMIRYDSELNVCTVLPNGIDAQYTSLTLPVFDKQMGGEANLIYFSDTEAISKVFVRPRWWTL